MSAQAMKQRAGFTLLELMIAVSLLVLVVLNLTMALNAAMRTSDREATEAVLEDQAQIVLDRVGYAIMGCARETLVPDAEPPLYSSDLRYQVHVGVEDGEVVWGDPERIFHVDGEDQVIWSQNPDEPEERRVVWSNLVQDLLEGETINGIDDNGNGLIDESGLTFTMDRDSVTIRISLLREIPGGNTITRTVETTVTCRNL
jgi:prepilin-type N-terminal cleavage/methylation domain-containing protein